MAFGTADRAESKSSSWRAITWPSWAPASGTPHANSRRHAYAGFIVGVGGTLGSAQKRLRGESNATGKCLSNIVNGTCVR